MDRGQLVQMQKADKVREAREGQRQALRGAELLVEGRGGHNTAPMVRYEPLKPRKHTLEGLHRDAASLIRDRRAGHDRPVAVRQVRLPIPRQREVYTPVSLRPTSDLLIQAAIDKYGPR